MEGEAPNPSTRQDLHSTRLTMHSVLFAGSNACECRGRRRTPPRGGTCDSRCGAARGAPPTCPPSWRAAGRPSWLRVRLPEQCATLWCSQTSQARCKPPVCPRVAPDKPPSEQLPRFCDSQKAVSASWERPLHGQHGWVLSPQEAYRCAVPCRQVRERDQGLRAQRGQLHGRRGRPACALLCCRIAYVSCCCRLQPARSMAAELSKAASKPSASLPVLSAALPHASHFAELCRAGQPCRSAAQYGCTCCALACKDTPRTDSGGRRLTGSS